MNPASFLLSALLLAVLQPGDSRLEGTLSKLNQSSAKFNFAEAKVHRESYNAVIKGIDDRQDGTIYFLRQGGSTEMGIRTTGKGARVVQYRNGTVKDFNPALKCYDTVTKPGLETYLTLGFGGSGNDLARAWNITDNGPDTIGGTRVEKLELIPKDPNVRSNVSKVQLWIDLERDVTLRQVFFSPSGDSNTATFSDVETRKKPDTGKYSFGGKPCWA